MTKSTQTAPSFFKNLDTWERANNRRTKQNHKLIFNVTGFDALAPLTPYQFNHWRHSPSYGTPVQVTVSQLREITAAGGSPSDPPSHNSYHLDRDPDAMDVDRMSPEENARHRKKGLCFNCHEPGHVSRNCPKKNGAGKSSYGKNMVCHEAAKDEAAKGGKSKIEEIEDSNEESDEEEMQVDRIRRIKVQKGKAKDF
ncbi:hypothetical protein K503DRAFT_804758 [Rhizopogon vinicolor AM-OR11-026]|uniref:CCHC-type domain-containing protein n=1 Tax=Rhizopogon vinicolor AM-OR11-026 TaxID=1314800 RepID=A0A1B7MK65_9AGAM|nr:hypothetical protein K503DRAFT_804758 [Rhizopogon vinicolor AM-OR11-026]